MWLQLSHTHIQQHSRKQGQSHIISDCTDFQTICIFPSETSLVPDRRLQSVEYLTVSISATITMHRVL